MPISYIYFVCILTSMPLISELGIDYIIGPGTILQVEQEGTHGIRLTKL